MEYYHETNAELSILSVNENTMDFVFCNRSAPPQKFDIMNHSWKFFEAIRIFQIELVFNQISCKTTYFFFLFDDVETKVALALQVNINCSKS